jgi:hypothetical protein
VIPSRTPRELHNLRNPASLRTPRELKNLQNGLILPKDPKNLELLLRDVDAKEFLDIELVYRLRQKESLGSVKQKIVRKIQEDETEKL